MNEYQQELIEEELEEGRIIMMYGDQTISIQTELVREWIDEGSYTAFAEPFLALLDTEDNHD